MCPNRAAEINFLRDFALAVRPGTTHRCEQRTAAAVVDTDGRGSERTIQVNAAGGAIVDSTGNPFYGNIVDNAGSSSSLYLSNTSGTTTFTKNPSASVRSVISGGGSLTWNGAGTLSLNGYSPTVGP